MRGRVLRYSVQENAGVISGDDGRRYTFEGPQWREQASPSQEMQVDFKVGQEPNRAEDVYVINSVTPFVGRKSKIVAGVLAIVLGPIGVHKFYLGYYKQGGVLVGLTILSFIVSVLLSAVPSGLSLISLITPLLSEFAFIPIFVITIIEGVIYLTKSDQEFDEIYVKAQKPWF